MKSTGEIKTGKDRKGNKPTFNMYESVQGRTKWYRKRATRTKKLREKSGNAKRDVRSGAGICQQKADHMGERIPDRLCRKYNDMTIRMEEIDEKRDCNPPIRKGQAQRI